MSRIAPVLLLTLLWLAISILTHAQQQAAQSGTASSASPTSSSHTSDTPAAKHAGKKVWTNEDLENLDDHSVNGAVINNRASSPKHTAKSTQVKSRDAKWYRGEIARLEARIPPLDDQIHDLEAALNGEPVNSSGHFMWSGQDDWHDQLARLEKQRADIEDKIANLEDEARHNGVPANTLP